MLDIFHPKQLQYWINVLNVHLHLESMNLCHLRYRSD